ncbi:hypothetical protein AF335_10250 [Streptomyces eurocidicus]|uniref:Uncharacterized protein n=1 Tax=Streptomyces eurocidicus TaxID=66423 RepID=A0A2N8NWZ5_STREU|nr:hypothetical protein [Streptomyces eurocidicus]MBB5117890.1 hypothetical protein [Streptomyces eurocidicus]PNE33293.1 hypothetical protein AF335_10250 [Streptomyces eurocidicus]
MSDQPHNAYEPREPYDPYRRRSEGYGQHDQQGQQAQQHQQYEPQRAPSGYDAYDPYGRQPQAPQQQSYDPYGSGHGQGQGQQHVQHQPQPQPHTQQPQGPAAWPTTQGGAGQDYASQQEPVTQTWQTQTWDTQTWQRPADTADPAPGPAARSGYDTPSWQGGALPEETPDARSAPGPRAGGRHAGGTGGTGPYASDGGHGYPAAAYDSAYDSAFDGPQGGSHGGLSNGLNGGPNGGGAHRASRGDSFDSSYAHASGRNGLAGHDGPAWAADPAGTGGHGLPGPAADEPGPGADAPGRQPTAAEKAKAEGRPQILSPGLKPALLTSALAALLAVAAPLGEFALAVPVVLLQAVTAAGWFRLNGMWPARQGIALAFLSGVAADAGLLATDADQAPTVLIGTLGVWLLLVIVLQLRSHAGADERLYGLTAAAASTAVTVVAAGHLAAAPDAVVVGAAGVAVAALARALPLPSMASPVVALIAAAGSGVATGQLTGVGASAALLALAAGACALVGLRVASYDYPSRFVHMTAGVALPLAAAAPAVYVIGRALT